LERSGAFRVLFIFPSGGKALLLADDPPKRTFGMFWIFEVPNEGRVGGAIMR
jgi:hypothetical protein